MGNKDYYAILGVPENAGQDEIKRAFRKLAFDNHPDRNPGREAEAAEKFKEINEAYGVLIDPVKRQQYNAFRRSGYTYAPGYQGTRFDQEDIFRNIFSNQALYEELNRMFAQGGLRFDESFLNNIFFSGRGFVIDFGPGGFKVTNVGSRSAAREPPRKRGLGERIITGAVGFLARRLLRSLQGPSTGVEVADLDLHADLSLTEREANAGGEKKIKYNRGGKRTALMVKVPPGIASGTRIRLKGMGVPANPPGDLYVHVIVR